MMNRRLHKMVINDGHENYSIFDWGVMVDFMDTVIMLVRLLWATISLLPVP